MNQTEMMQDLLGSIAEMLNGNYDDPAPGQQSIVVSWINRAHRSVKTTVNIDPLFAQYLSEIHAADYDQYICVSEQLEDLVAVKGFQQATDDDETWFISKEILEMESEKINRGEF